MTTKIHMMTRAGYATCGIDSGSREVDVIMTDDFIRVTCKHCLAAVK